MQPAPPEAQHESRPTAANLKSGLHFQLRSDPPHCGALGVGIKPRKRIFNAVS